MPHSAGIRCVPVVVLLALMSLAGCMGADSPSDPETTPRPDQALRVHVFDRPAKERDRLPGWLLDRTPALREIADTTRLSGTHGSLAVYLSLTSDLCLLAVDDVSRAMTRSCAAFTERRFVEHGFTVTVTSTADPCGLAIVVVPDGYRVAKVDQLVPVGSGENTALFRDPGSSLDARLEPTTGTAPSIQVEVHTSSRIRPTGTGCH